MNTRRFDALIIGGGGAGLRAALQLARSDFKVAVVSKVFPTRSHTVSAQGGITAASPTSTRTTGNGTCTTRSRAAIGWATRTRSSSCAVRRQRRCIELEHMGLPFSRLDNGKIYQRPFGGQSRIRR